MASRYKDKDGGIVLSFNGQWISWAHTAVAYSKSDRRGIEAVDGLESPDLRSQKLILHLKNSRSCIHQRIDSRRFFALPQDRSK
jgi:hypothetical protein